MPRKKNKHKNIGNDLNKTVEKSFFEKHDKNFLISVISLLVSIIIAIITFIITIEMNDFTRKTTPLNYDLEICGTSQKFEIDNVKYTLSPYKLVTNKDNISGEFRDVIFAFTVQTKLDVLKVSENEELKGYYSTNDDLIMIESAEQGKISFYYNNIGTSENNYGFFHIIFHGYNGDYKIYTLVYSRETFDAFIVDNIIAHSLVFLNESINRIAIDADASSLNKEITEAQKFVLSSLQ